MLPLVFPTVGVGGLMSMSFGAGVFSFIFFHRLVVTHDTPIEYVVTATLETFTMLGMSLRVGYALVVANDSWNPSPKKAMGYTWTESVRVMVPELCVGCLLFVYACLTVDSLGSFVLIGVWSTSFVAGPFILRYMSHETVTQRIET